MIERVLFDIGETRFVRTCVSLMNRLACPGSRFPVKVYGHRMFVAKNDRYLSLWLRKFHLSETLECRLVSKLCRPGMCVADVGANAGFYSLLFARHVGPAGRVWAFEPDPVNFAMLQRNVEANGYSNVTMINKAVGAASGKDYLYISDIHTGDHRTYPSEPRDRVPVEVVALDDYFPAGQKIDVIKIDIQGSEGKALEGMSRTLREQRELTILMEFWPKGLSQAGFIPEKVIRDLQELGLKVEVCDKRTGAWEAVEDPSRLAKSLVGNQYTNVVVSSARQ
jgi:FkbM family methyltransferase